jgi:CBS domain-containing protein
VSEFVERHLLQRRHAGFPLLDAAGEPAGLMTAGRVTAVLRDRWPDTPLSAVACPMSEVPVAAPDEPLTDLLPRLGVETGGRALVLDRGRLVGIVSPLDITRGIERSEFIGPVTATPAPRSGARPPLLPRP